jgi:hypothetical protein
MNLAPAVCNKIGETGLTAGECSCLPPPPAIVSTVAGRSTAAGLIHIGGIYPHRILRQGGGEGGAVSAVLSSMEHILTLNLKRCKP